MATNINTMLAERIQGMQVTPAVNKLIWIGAQSHSDELDEICNDLVNHGDVGNSLRRMFPGLEEDFEDIEHWDDGDQLKYALLDTQRLGFLAEVNIPECDQFKFDAQGDPKSWRVAGVVSRVEYAYAETPTGLVDAIEERVNSVFQDYVTKAKNKQN